MAWRNEYRKDGSIEMYPYEELDHEESIDCWCLPVLSKICPGCGGDGCKMCEGGGVVDATREDVENGVPIIVVHNRLGN